MARDRIIPSDFWTWEAVIDCAAMTRLLFLGLWNFADDFGVQPLRPRTIRMQVFPGDSIDNDDVRAMVDELAARKLVRVYEVEGLEYLEIVGWSQFQRVGKRAKRRYPGFPTPAEGGQVDAMQNDAANARDHSKPSQSASPDPGEARPTPPAWPSALAPPSTPVGDPALHR